jgi:predicted GNAT family acetyltransferase
MAVRLLAGTPTVGRRPGHVEAVAGRTDTGIVRPPIALDFRPGNARRTEVAMRDNTEKSRFELDVDGQIVFADYHRAGDLVVIRHVEAPVPLRGTGAASRLMRGVAEAARADGLTIRPRCGYAAAWLRRHREFADLVG